MMDTLKQDSKNLNRCCHVENQTRGRTRSLVDCIGRHNWSRKAENNYHKNEPHYKRELTHIISPGHDVFGVAGFFRFEQESGNCPFCSFLRHPGVWGLVGVGRGVVGCGFVCACCVCRILDLACCLKLQKIFLRFAGKFLTDEVMQ